nr:MAG TPA: hypothetical protein [Caudoviricetes sp.]DAH53804.1 MAG TPA: hypothetical protein [Caudoviricetes sp.]
MAIGYTLKQGTKVRKSPRSSRPAPRANGKTNTMILHVPAYP